MYNPTPSIQPDSNQAHLIVLDPTRMMTTGQYAAAKGISAGRISQMKNEGKLNVFPVPQFGLELIIVEENELELLRAIPRVQEPIYSFNYRQLGGYFANLLNTYEQDLTNAERIAREQQQARQQVEQINEDLQARMTALEETNTALTEQRQQESEKRTAAESECNRLQEAVRQYEEQARNWKAEKEQLEEALSAANTRQDTQADIRSELSALREEVAQLRASTEKVKPSNSSRNRKKT